MTLDDRARSTSSAIRGSAASATSSSARSSSAPASRRARPCSGTSSEAARRLRSTACSPTRLGLAAIDAAHDGGLGDDDGAALRPRSSSWRWPTRSPRSDASRSRSTRATACYLGDRGGRCMHRPGERRRRRPTLRACAPRLSQPRCRLFRALVTATDTATRSTSCASTRSGRCRWTPCRRPTPGIPARRWRSPRSPTCSTRG